ncbi:MAG TPA: hypothetical protein DDW52_02545 [Planctomycetaceae bacterium]|nr:hypothetical protein [Planctomycetaceae bacterium]
MDPGFAKRAASIFEASLEIPENEIAQWLQDICKGDAHLVQQVNELRRLRIDANDMFALDTTAEASDSRLPLKALENATLGDFKIECLLGSGGMGEVYRAQQLSLDRVVALKVLHPLNRSASALRRFKAEITAAAQLHHENIVRVFSSGNDGSNHFFAMELVEGPNLGEVIHRLRSDPANKQLPHSNLNKSTQPGSLEPPKQQSNTAPDSQLGEPPLRLPRNTSDEYFQWIASLVAAVADGLDYAHAQLLVHRDIKPANLLLSLEGKILISDFGLARNTKEPGITQSGEILGTPFYMSPEQLSSSTTLDHRTDIYSLGATLYELLTLQPPFPGESRERVLAQIANEEPARPRRINPKIPKDLETICLKALEKSVDARFQSAAELAADLRRYLDGQPIRARRTGIVEYAVKWANRHRGLAASLAALPCCVAVVATLFAFQNYRLAMRLQAETLRANEVVFDAKIEQARALRSTDNPLRRAKSLDSLSLALQTLPKLNLSQAELSGRLLDLRNEAIATLAIPELNVAQTFLEEKPWTVEVTFSPGFQSYAQASRAGPVRIVPLGKVPIGNENVVTLVGQSEPARQMKFSADGRFLATKHYKRGLPDSATICVWNLQTNTSTNTLEPILQLKNRWIFVSDFDFSPASRTFVAHKPEKGIEIYDLDRLPTPTATVPFEVPGTILALLPDNRLAFAEHRGRELRFANLDGDVNAQESMPIAGRVTAMGWRKQPETFFVGTSEGDIHLWRGRTTGSPQIVRVHEREITSVCCHPNRQLVATGTLDEKVALTDLTTGKSQRISTSEERLHLCSGGFSSSGQELGFYRLGEYGYWRVSKSPVLSLGTDDEPKLFTEIHFHPQNAQVVARGCSGKIELWDIQGGELLASLATVDTQSFRFSKDGRYLFLASKRKGLLAVSVSIHPLDVAESLSVELGKEKPVFGEHCTVLAISRDGKRLAVSCFSDAGYSLAVLDVATLNVISKVDGLPRPKSLHFGSTGEKVYVCGYQTDRLIEVAWESGETKEPVFLPTDIIDIAAANSADLFAVRGADYLDLFGGQRWDKQSNHSTGKVRSARVGLNEDGTLAAINYDETTTQLMEPTSGRILARLQANPREIVRNYKFSPSASTLAIAGSRNMQFWDLELLNEQLMRLGLGW